jgi:hypothetical protein
MSFTPRYLVSKGNLRRVRTLAGVKFFGAPIGTIITPGMAFKARRTHGDEALKEALDAEDRASTDTPGQDLVTLKDIPPQKVTRDYVAVPDQRGHEGMEERARRQKELRDLRRAAMNRKHQ